ncbi:transglutaminase-like domain-containing protein [Paeniglutamicibacter psychrophenolicus]|uniref:transglutaminase-like domain-containing protein n=1 Tax=Paeniglutamicibacter psychrophenolicus TaxID=257454 RepID=UPI002783EC91|nr:transglutaminase-like domain-containing protein [Paeniglutamicibacter psychrophenolicus]MDQ0092171.1 hypothetical protein [Paeniglutamicibacter psychrophenolicus]
MTCPLTTTARLRRADAFCGSPAVGTTHFTPILDGGDPVLLETAARLRAGTGSDLEFLREAHRWIQQRIRPVYSLNETQPASVTLAKGRGSCSQRIALLEALARGAGIATRSEALLIHGSFWHPRFRYLRRAVPQHILIVWPDFRLDSGWLNLSDLFVADAKNPAPAFANQGAETLFDAIATGSAHWVASGCAEGSCMPAELAQIDRSLGRFADRDAVFARYGQNLPGILRVVLEPVFGRWAARG